MFGPRSTIRVTINENCFVGALFIAFQGLKILDSHFTNQPQFQEGEQGDDDAGGENVQSNACGVFGIRWETRRYLSTTRFVSSSKGYLTRVVNSVVTVSIEATFTAVSIGYGVIPS